MAAHRWFERSQPIAGAPGVAALEVGQEAWSAAALDIAAAGGRLIALWAGPASAGAARLHAAYAAEPGVLVLSLGLAAAESEYPALHEIYPAAARMQRAVADLSGLLARGADRRPWLRHAAWPPGFLPLAGGAPAEMPRAAVIDDYEFVRVTGDGVHEIAVGPVHAGIIEPGHFRFSVVGEKLLRLEQRLGYVHKGIERRFAGMRLESAHALAARVSGDSAVAYSWAYCQAVEGMACTALPPRVAWLRALALELERLANHLGDLGALGNDAGFAFGLAQFSRLKEMLLRLTEGALGQRYLMDFIVPGGISVAPAQAALAELGGFATALSREVASLRQVYDEHAGLRDRFSGAGVVAPELALRLGLTGLAGRASGQAFDLRIDLPCQPYDELQPAKVGSGRGDVAARVAVRFDEVAESCRLVREIVTRLPGGDHRTALPSVPDGAMGVGFIEGWRGPVFVAVSAGPNGLIGRCHPHDPSWQNWPVLEHAVVDNIVPDFPLINKSFNLSYSGHDL
jgi:Ni,Fe-hydrogenase III large subunit